jgi:hypothetical protein
MRIVGWRSRQMVDRYAASAQDRRARMAHGDRRFEPADPDLAVGRRGERLAGAVGPVGARCGSSGDGVCSFAA